MQLEDNSQVKRPAKVVKIIQTTKLNYKIMDSKIIFQAKGGINEKSTVTITLFDKVDEERPYVLQVIIIS